MSESESIQDSLPFSKRAARRLIQRAFVLVGRDRHVRDHLRAASMVTLWVLEDWKLAWTVGMDRGKIHFERRPAKRPDLTLTWRTAEGFFKQIQTGCRAKDSPEICGDASLRKLVESVLKAFCASLSALLRNPIDEVGESLL